MQRGLSPALDDDTDVGEQDYVHHQCIDDGRNSNDAIVENEWAGSDGNSLRCILHAHLNDDGSLLACLKATQMTCQP